MHALATDRPTIGMD